MAAPRICDNLLTSKSTFDSLISNDEFDSDVSVLVARLTASFTAPMPKPTAKPNNKKDKFGCSMQSKKKSERQEILALFFYLRIEAIDLYEWMAPLIRWTSLRRRI